MFVRMISFVEKRRDVNWSVLRLMLHRTCSEFSYFTMGDQLVWGYVHAWSYNQPGLISRSRRGEISTDNQIGGCCYVGDQYWALVTQNWDPGLVTRDWVGNWVWFCSASSIQWGNRMAFPNRRARNRDFRSQNVRLRSIEDGVYEYTTQTVPP